MLPFIEQKENNCSIRTFSKDVDDHELKWHQDLETRKIIPIGENDWLIQFEDCLPEPISKPILVLCGQWHRVIKGSSDLVVQIEFVDFTS